MAELDIIFEDDETPEEKKGNEHFPEISVKKDLREHVLARPDTYLGSFVCDKYTVLTVTNKKIGKEVVEYNPAFERCVIEVGSNCIDNVWRSSQFGAKCTAIRFSWSADGRLTFWNDGLTIPVLRSKIPELAHLYNPSIVFGVFMSSTNYNDSEKRRTSGRNGYGAKLTNTMSKEFTVETQDEKNRLWFKQTWRNNMEMVEEPVVKTQNGKGYTQVTWLPDYARFKMAGITEAIVRLISKYLYDMAMTARVPVYINGELVPVRSLLDYAMSTRSEPTTEYLHIEANGSEVVVFPQKPGQTVSYVNGIPTSQGGVHVDAWARAIFTPLTGKVNKDDKKKEEKKKDEKKEPKLTTAEVRSYFSLFVVSSVDNPAFTSQEKVKLTSPVPETSFKVTHLNKMMKWSVITKLQDLLDEKLLKAQTKKLEGTRKSAMNVEKLEDANLAGTSRSQECVLIYCEGDSAKTYAVTGIEKGIYGKQGRDYFGILPCGGKSLNVRKAKAEKVADNKGVQSLIQALNLRIGVDYSDESNFRSLRYGQVMIIADADVDGIHIEGLCHNLFHKMFPSLLKRDPPFIVSMRTPLIRVKLRDGTEKKFYREQAFKEFQEYHSAEIKGKPDYFKGLGGSDDSQVIDSFGERLVTYSVDETLDDEMTKAFGKKNARDRKQWLSDYNPDDILIIENEDAKAVQQSYSSFINNDLVTYSIANCDRSLPNMIDGLKESQRKILYTMMKKKLFHDKPAMKVYRIAGAVGDMTEYTHGDASLCDAMVGMTWDFVGSNNIPLLTQRGQFGSRLAFGRDAANTRYSSTTLEEITSYIFRTEDTALLKYKRGEDDFIEPEYYVPVIPMVLINGVRAGIGTGWASKVPAYNPLHVTNCLKTWIKENLDTPTRLDDRILLSDLPELTPWYQGFEGPIERNKIHQFVTSGVVRVINDITKEVTELPIGMSTDSFREKLKLLRAEEKIIDFADYSSKTKVHFVINEHPEKLSCSVNSLKLTRSVSTSNMVGFNVDGKIHKYDSTDEIIYDFAQVRIKLYQTRKDHIIKALGQKIVTSTAKRRFVEEVINKQIEIYRKKRAEIAKVLEEREYPLFEGKYEYLLKMPIDSFTEDMIHKLDGDVAKMNAELNIIESTSTRDMWMKEILEFEDAYHRYLDRWAKHQALVNCSRQTKAVGVPKKKIVRRTAPKKK